MFFVLQRKGRLTWFALGYGILILLGRYVEAAWNNTHGAAGAKVDVTAKVLGGCSPPVSVPQLLPRDLFVQIKRQDCEV